MGAAQGAAASAWLRPILPWIKGNSMATSVYGLPNGKVAGNLISYAELNLIGDTAEEFFTKIVEYLGVGFLQSTDFNGAVVPGQLSVDLSGGIGIVGVSLSRALIYQDGTERVTGLTASDTNRIFLLPDGTYEVVDSAASDPADGHLACTVVTSGTEATSVNNLPTGRVNFGTVLSTASLASATPTALTIAGAGAVGSSALVARADHSHPMPAGAAAVAISNTNGAGSASTFSRSDHTHAMGSSAVDGTTLEVASGAARIKDLGVSTAKLAAQGVTVAKLENTLQDALPKCTISVGAEASNVIQVSIQFKDVADNNLADRMGAFVWLSGSQHGAEVGTAPSGGWSAGVGTLISTAVAGKSAYFLSDATGLLRIDLTEAGAASFYVHVIVGNKAYASPVVAFT